MLRTDLIALALWKQLEQIHFASATEQAKVEFARMDERQKRVLLMAGFKSRVEADRSGANPGSVHLPCDPATVALFSKIDGQIAELFGQPDLDIDELFGEIDDQDTDA